VDIGDAQWDVPTVFLGGFQGQLVSRMGWFVSPALTAWYSTKTAISLLVFAGMFISPMTQLLLRRMGRPFSLAKGHPMNDLAMQIAFTVPFSLPLVASAAPNRLAWFYPAFMMVSVRGMWQFGLHAGER
jgi:hypothetical protein